MHRFYTAILVTLLDVAIFKNNAGTLLNNATQGVRAHAPSRPYFQVVVFHNMHTSYETISDFLENTSVSRQHEFVVVFRAEILLIEDALGRQSETIQHQGNEIKYQHKLLECACIVIGTLILSISVHRSRYAD